MDARQLDAISRLWVNDALEAATIEPWLLEWDAQNALAALLRLRQHHDELADSIVGNTVAKRHAGAVLKKSYDEHSLAEGTSGVCL